MHKETITAGQIASPAGHYFPATVFDHLIFVSGQIGQIPDSGLLISPDIKAQASRP